MRARDFREHFKAIASWVDWENTVDLFMHGDPETVVDGVAVTWLATDSVLREAAALDCNLMISHEGAFYPQFAGMPSEDRHHARKHALMNELGITLLRCHDTWDRMPEWGIPDAWAAYLGYLSPPRAAGSYYRLCEVGSTTVEELARDILDKVKPLGQGHVGVMGNLQKQVSKMAVGTGAITRLAEMYELGADVILATDDGAHTTYSGLWSLDLDVPVLVVNHATAELPGMMSLARYIEKQFPGIRAEYLGCRFPYPSIT